MALFHKILVWRTFSLCIFRSIFYKNKSRNFFLFLSGFWHWKLFFRLTPISLCCYNRKHATTVNMQQLYIKFMYTTYDGCLNWALWSFFMLVDAIKQHLEGKIVNSIRRKLTLRPKRPIVFFITQSSNEKCRKWHFRDARFKIFCKSTLLDSLLWTAFGARYYLLVRSP